MLLADSNFWVALSLASHPFHDAAKSWLTRRSPRERIGFCRFTQLSFLRLMTTAAVMAPYGIPPLQNEAAWMMYQDFRRHKRIAFIDEPSGLDALWHRLAARPVPSPKLWMDAYLAAFAIAGTIRLITADTAFRQFADLSLIVIGT